MNFSLFHVPCGKIFTKTLKINFINIYICLFVYPKYYTTFTIKWVFLNYYWILNAITAFKNLTWTAKLYIDWLLFFHKHSFSCLSPLNTCLIRQIQIKIVLSLLKDRDRHHPFRQLKCDVKTLWYVRATVCFIYAPWWADAPVHMNPVNISTLRYYK